MPVQHCPHCLDGPTSTGPRRARADCRLSPVRPGGGALARCGQERASLVVGGALLLVAFLGGVGIALVGETNRAPTAEAAAAPTAVPAEELPPVIERAALDLASLTGSHGGQARVVKFDRVAARGTARVAPADAPHVPPGTAEGGDGDGTLGRDADPDGDGCGTASVSEVYFVETANVRSGRVRRWVIAADGGGQVVSFSESPSEDWHEDVPLVVDAN